RAGGKWGESIGGGNLPPQGRHPASNRAPLPAAPIRGQLRRVLAHPPDLVQKLPVLSLRRRPAPLPCQRGRPRLPRRGGDRNLHRYPPLPGMLPRAARRGIGEPAPRCPPHSPRPRAIVVTRLRRLPALRSPVRLTYRLLR